MIAKGIKEYLESKGFDTVYVSSMPDVSDVVCLYDEPAPVFDYQHSFGSDNFGVQVIAKGSYNFARNKIYDIHKAVTMLGGETLDGILVVDTQIQTQPSQLDIDSEGERKFTAHYIFLCETTDNTFRQP